MSFPRYPTYKDSGVGWLGEVPDEWDICEGKRVFCSRRQIALESDPQLAASQKFGVIPQSLMMELNDSKVMLALKGTESFRHVEENDFVVSLRSFEGGIEHSNYRGCVSPAYTVLHATKPVESGFFRHLFKSGPYVSALQSTTDSLRDGKSISYQQFGAIPVPLPPLGEQQAIATFLDHETTKIDALIAEQENLIALLKEKRQAVISHAVTKGLDPTVPMKDSGIEWLGEVPDHWSLKRLKQLLKKSGLVRGPFGGDLKKEIFVDEGYKVYEQKNAIYKNFALGDSYISEQKYTEMQRFRVRKNDYILSCSGTIGKAFRIPSEAPDGIINQALLIVRFDDSIISIFSDWIFEANFFQLQILDNSQGGAMKNLVGMDIFTCIVLPVPPRSEQKAIAAYLDNETAKLDDLTTEAQHTIDLLKERRSALISAAVTGKIDVRRLSDKVLQ